MITQPATVVRNIIRRFGLDIVRRYGPVTQFHSDGYLRQNARVQEHLSSLRIPVAGKSVLEVGAGIGDHSHYFIDRGCKLTITEGRPENLAYLRRRFPALDVRHLDLEHPATLADAPFDVVYCYGLLYHLSDPHKALQFMSANSKTTLLLETCVSFGDDEAIHPTWERMQNPTQSLCGTGCRPTRPWIFRTLQKLFDFVYIPITQPNHECFPVDWTDPGRHTGHLSRAVFIASRGPIDNDLLADKLLMHQRRHE